MQALPLVIGILIGIEPLQIPRLQPHVFKQQPQHVGGALVGVLLLFGESHHGDQAKGVHEFVVGHLRETVVWGGGGEGEGEGVGVGEGEVVSGVNVGGLKCGWQAVGCRVGGGVQSLGR